MKARGDRGPIEETLTTVVTAKMDREIDAAPKSLADFGLDKPAAEVDLTLKDGKHLALLLGAKSPTGVWVYAKERDKPNVFVVGESVLRDATRAGGRLPRQDRARLLAPDVTGIEIVTAAGHDRARARGPEVEDDAARRRGPRTATASPSSSSKLGRGAGEGVRGGVAALARPYGLDRPLRLVVCTWARRRTARHARSSSGDVDEAKKGVYAMREGESSVLLVPEETWKAVPAERGGAARQDRRRRSSATRSRATTSRVPRGR